MKYRAFLSYSHANEKWARWLHRSLERYRVPKHLATSAGAPGARLRPVFLDRDELGSSGSLSDSIRSALAESEALIVVCSPAAANSKWVNQEVEEYQRLFGGANIYCCIVEGTAPDVFPPALLRSGEPLAADLTPAADGKRAGLTKLVAGLLGVGFDDLRRREYQVRNRKLAAIAVASIVGMAVTTGLGVSALIARQEAERAQQEAVQRREQAEDLLAFMVGDLRESLEPLGRLDLLDRVGDEAMDYFKSVEANAISDRSLTLQSQVLTQIGEIRMSQYQYEQASRAFEEAYRHVEPLVLRYPGDGEMLFQRSQAEFWVGYMRWRTGDLDGAQQWLQRYYESSLELTVLDPSRDDWLQEVAWGHHNLGVLAVDQKHLGRARELFANELLVWKDLLDRSPGDQDIPENIADAYSWLGRISEYEGNLAAALFNYSESARYRAELLAASPDHAGHKQWSVVARAFVAGTRALMGQVREAADAYSELIAAQAKMAEEDPENQELQRYLARLQVDSAELSVSAETEAERSRGLAIVGNAIATLERFLRAEPEDRRSRIALAKAYRVEAVLNMLRERAGAALEAALKAVALLAEQLDDVRANQEFGAALVVALAAGSAENLNLGGHDLADHLANFRRHAEGSRDPRTLDALARVAIREGDTNQAVEIIGQLERSGYVPMQDWPASPR